MNLPIPEVSGYVAGFASACGLMVAAVAVRHLWPSVKGYVSTAESAVYADYKKAIAFFDSKLNGLSTTFASAVNAVRGDVGALQQGIAYLEDRVFTLEKAVGVQNPTEEAPHNPAPVNPAAITPIAQPGVVSIPGGSIAELIGLPHA